MRLLEYQVKKFFTDCIYSNTEKHECAGKGYNLAYWMEKKMEHWLDNKDCTVEDFIRAVYESNATKARVSETELFEILARFLCGYDVYDKYTDLDSNEVDEKISNQDLLKKLDDIEACVA